MDCILHIDISIKYFGITETFKELFISDGAEGLNSRADFA